MPVLLKNIDEVKMNKDRTLMDNTSGSSILNYLGAYY